MIDWTRPSMLADARQARGRTSRGRSGPCASAEIADAIADERQAVVVEIGDDDLTDLAGSCGAAVSQDLDDVSFADDVMALVGFALVGDAGELARAIFVENRQPKASSMILRGSTRAASAR